MFDTVAAPPSPPSPVKPAPPPPPVVRLLMSCRCSRPVVDRSGLRLRVAPLAAIAEVEAGCRRCRRGRLERGRRLRRRWRRSRLRTYSPRRRPRRCLPLPLKLGGPVSPPSPPAPAGRRGAIGARRCWGRWKPTRHICGQTGVAAQSTSAPGGGPTPRHGAAVERARNRWERQEPPRGPRWALRSSRPRRQSRGHQQTADKAIREINLVTSVPPFARSQPDRQGLEFQCWKRIPRLGSSHEASFTVGQDQLYS